MLTPEEQIRKWAQEKDILIRGIDMTHGGKYGISILSAYAPKRALRFIRQQRLGQHLEKDILVLPESDRSKIVFLSDDEWYSLYNQKPHPEQKKMERASDWKMMGIAFGIINSIFSIIFLISLAIG